MKAIEIKAILKSDLLSFDLKQTFKSEAKALKFLRYVRKLSNVSYISQGGYAPNRMKVTIKHINP